MYCVRAYVQRHIPRQMETSLPIPTTQCPLLEKGLSVQAGNQNSPQTSAHPVCVPCSATERWWEQLAARQGSVVFNQYAETVDAG